MTRRHSSHGQGAVIPLLHTKNNGEHGSLQGSSFVIENAPQGSSLGLLLLYITFQLRAFGNVFLRNAGNLILSKKTYRRDISFDIQASNFLWDFPQNAVLNGMHRMYEAVNFL